MSIKEKIINDLAEYATECYADGKAQGKSEAIESCIKAMHDFYKSYLDMLPSEADMELIKIAVLNPQREIHRIFKNMKEE